MSKNKFKVGDIIEKETNGFQRKVGRVIGGYPHANDHFGYYYFQRYEEGEGWQPIHRPCSESHLQSWGDKIGHEPVEQDILAALAEAVQDNPNLLV